MTAFDPQLLIDKWKERSSQAHPSDAMVINMQIRELREAMAETGEQQVGQLIQRPAAPHAANNAPSPTIRMQVGAVQGDSFTDSVIDERLNGLYRHLRGSGQHNGGMSVVAWDRAVYRAAIASRQPVCATCRGWGLIGGPSFYAPDEGGAPCPDCNPAASQPVPAQGIDLGPQPIETAPKDGRTAILLFEGGEWFVGLRPCNCPDDAAADSMGTACYPSHWAPMPPKPKIDGQRDAAPGVERG